MLTRLPAAPPVSSERRKLTVDALSSRASGGRTSRSAPTRLPQAQLEGVAGANHVGDAGFGPEGGDEGEPFVGGAVEDGAAGGGGGGEVVVEAGAVEGGDL